jgi:hypothetical protein
MKTLNRRELLEAFGAAAGMAFTIGCGSSPTNPTAPSSSGSGGPTGGGPSIGASCVITPSETEGPYPDRIGMISNPVYFRRDVREDKSGLPVTLTLTVVNVNAGCSAVANANVEIWQCDATGNYSEYSQPGFDGTGQTFLRGVQTTDGRVCQLVEKSERVIIRLLIAA